MSAEPVGFDAIIERGRKNLRTKYLRGIQNQAEPLFDAEAALVRSLNFEEALVQIVAYGDQLRQLEVNFHVIGAGGSSLILFVLGMSEVNPVQHDTYYQRLWLTSDGKPPTLQIVADSIGKPDLGDVSPPPYVSVHPMTMLEAIPNRLESHVGVISTTKLDQATLASLQAGDTDGVFQFHTERAKWLLSQIRPANIEELASVTALEQISHSHPEIVITYLEQYQEVLAARQMTGRRPSVDIKRRLPILFQELLMTLLRRVTKLSWNDTYPFIRAAAKGQVDDQHDRWKSALDAMKVSDSEKPDELLRRLVESSRWAVCRAHHIANALTSYKAAYCRTHHRLEFENVRRHINTAMDQGA